MSKKSGQPARAAVARAPNGAREHRPAAARARGLEASLEQELYATCGGLLGAVEALAYELPDPPPPRIERALRDARKYGQRVREQMEALAILSLDELAQASERVPFSLPRWLDHACRGASASISSYGGSLELPELAELEDVRLPLAVSRMDRALTVMLEQLGQAAGPGALIRVHIDVTSAQVTLALRAHFEVAARQAGAGTPVSPVFVRAWERLFAFHGGTFHYEQEPLMMTCELPMTAGPT